MSKALKHYCLCCAGLVVCCAVVFQMVPDGARRSAPHPHVPDKGDAIWYEAPWKTPSSFTISGSANGTWAGILAGPVVQGRYGRQCDEGTVLKSTQDGVAVCVYQEPVEDRLDRIEKKLDAVLRQVTPKDTPTP